MSFLEILKELVDGLDGSMAAILMGMDGITVEKYTAEGVGGGGGEGGEGAAARGGYDIESAGVEYGKVMEEVKNAARILNLGDLEEVTVAGEGLSLIMRMASPDYFIAFAMEAGSNKGRASYLVRKAAKKAEKEF